MGTRKGRGGGLNCRQKGVHESMWESSMWEQRPEACLGSSE